MDVDTLTSGNCNDSTFSLCCRLSSSKTIIVNFFDIKFFTDYNKIDKIKKRWLCRKSHQWRRQNIMMLLIKCAAWNEDILTKRDLKRGHQMMIVVVSSGMLSIARLKAACMCRDLILAQCSSWSDASLVSSSRPSMMFEHLVAVENSIFKLSIRSKIAWRESFTVSLGATKMFLAFLEFQKWKAFFSA